MKKRIFLIILALFFVLLGALALYIQSDAFSDRITPPLTAELKRAYGPDISAGRFKAGLIPLYLEVRDLSVPDDRGAYAITVRKARAYINPLPLIFRRISIPSLSVLEPRVSVERSAAGSVNLARLIERFAPSPKPSAPPYTFSLRSLSIRNGTLSYIDHATGSRSAASGITMSLRGDMRDRTAGLSLKNADITVMSPAFPELRLALKASAAYEQGRLSIDSFSLAAHDAWATVSGSAENFPEGALDVKVKARLGAAAIGKMTGMAMGTSLPHLDLSVSVKGTAADPDLEGGLSLRGFSSGGITIKEALLEIGYRARNLTLEGARWKLVRDGRSALVDGVRAALEYRDTGLDIRHCEISGDDFQTRLTGRVDFRKGLDASLTAGSTGKNRFLSVLTALPLDGTIAVAGRFTGPLNAPRFDGSLLADAMTVRGVLFSRAEGALIYQDRKVLLKEMEIRQQASRYVFDGSVDLGGKEPLYAARLDVIRSDAASIVSLFYKPLPLQLSAKGELTFSGTRSEYTGAAILSLDAGKAYGETFAGGAIKASLATGKIAFPQVVLYKGSGVVKGAGWIAFDGTYSADIQSRFVDLAEVNLLRGVPVSGPFKFDVRSSGSFRDPSVQASLEVPDLSYQSVPIGVSSAVLGIRDRVLTLTSGVADGRAEMQGTLTLRAPYAWSAGLSVHAERIDPFVVAGKKELMGRVQAAVDGTLTASGNGLDPSRLSAIAAFPRLRLNVGDYKIENEHASGFTVDAGRLRITSLTFVGPATKLSVSGGARLLRELDLLVSGSANISLLRLLYREVEHGEGLVELRLAVRDDWNNPDISGDLRIQNGTVKVRDIPQRFAALNGKLSFSEGRVLVDSLNGEIGGGSLDLSGWLQLAGLALRDFMFKVTGTGLTVRYPEGVTSTLSGELFYEGTEGEQTLSGDVEIKTARYEKRVEWKTMLVEMARGLYQKKKTDVGWIGDTRLNIRFRGKEGILLQNNLAKVPIDADVLLRGTINKLQLVGRLEARRGIVYFRNSEFRILRASADFIDPARLNPVLDIQAETRARDYLIRLAVTGTAERAVVSFLSEPPLSDPDILGVLALGKTGTELKGKEAGVGMGEAISFATGQFQDIFEQRARSLTGLDRFQVDPYVSRGDTSVPRVTVGKEIVRSKLYVTYSSNVGATAPEPILKVEYILSRNLSIVGEQNELGKIGADVKFRFEFK